GRSTPRSSARRWHTPARRSKGNSFTTCVAQRSATWSVLVPQPVAMAISGHRTTSMFLRYNITSEQDMREAARKVSAHVKREGVLAQSAAKGHRKGTTSQTKGAEDCSPARSL